MSGSTERADVQALARRVLSSTVNAPADRDAAVLADAYLRIAAALQAAEEARDHYLSSLRVVEAWVRRGEGTEAEAAERMDAALAAASTEGAE